MNEAETVVRFGEEDPPAPPKPDLSHRAHRVMAGIGWRASANAGAGVEEAARC
jgi:hypothetical protein